MRTGAFYAPSHIVSGTGYAVDSFQVEDADMDLIDLRIEAETTASYSDLFAELPWLAGIVNNGNLNVSNGNVGKY